MSIRPLRADAERNRQRILAAASTVFAERGLDVSLDDIAGAAGVGVGTVYRRFPDKDALIDALFEDKIADVERVAMARDRIAPIAMQVLQRAQNAGVVRADLGAFDVPLMHFAVGYVAEST